METFAKISLAVILALAIWWMVDDRPVEKISDFRITAQDAGSVR